MSCRGVHRAVYTGDVHHEPRRFNARVGLTEKNGNSPTRSRSSKCTPVLAIRDSTRLLQQNASVLDSIGCVTKTDLRERELDALILPNRSSGDAVPHTRTQ